MPDADPLRPCRVLDFRRQPGEPYQAARYRLVKVLDRLLDELAGGRPTGPVASDGQSALLEDYLEVRPERFDQVEQLLREGRLLAGPWYVVPDDSLVGGESLLRNLRLGQQLVANLGGEPCGVGILLGRQLAANLGGEPSGVGMLAEQSRHSSQLPQVFRGFGIPAAVVAHEAVPAGRRHFLWRGADGSEIPVYCLQRAVQDQQAVLREPAEPADETIAISPTGLDQCIAALAARAEPITERREGALADPVEPPSQAEPSGAVRDVAAARAWFHRQNAECETLLCRWAEPMSVIAASLLGDEYPDNFLHVAWRSLLQNHAYDAIGDGDPQVRADQEYRFRHCRQIAEKLTDEATRTMAANVAGELGDDELRVVVFNPAPLAHQGTVNVRLLLPESWLGRDEAAGPAPEPAFRIRDYEGNDLPYQRVSTRASVKGDSPIFADTKIGTVPTPDAAQASSRVVTVSLPLEVPAVGYTTLAVRRECKHEPGRTPERPGLATGPRSMENEQLAVSIEPDGTLSVIHKASGRAYRGLLTLAEAAAIDPQTAAPSGASADVSLLHDGPMLTGFRVRTRLGTSAGRVEGDSPIFADTKIGTVPVGPALDSLVSLRPGVDYLEVQTTVRDAPAGSPLRVLFPTGVDAGSCLADGPWDVFQRPLAGDCPNFRVGENGTVPLDAHSSWPTLHESWTAVGDDQGGLALVSPEAPECAVLDVPGRPIALTLDPAAWDAGRDATFRCRIVPLAGPPDRVRLGLLGQQVSAGLRQVQLDAEDLSALPSRLWLPPSLSFLEIRGRFLVSSLRQVNGAIELRVWNPGDEPVEAAMRLAGRSLGVAEAVWADQVDFRSESIGQGVPGSSGAFYFPLRPKEIATFRLSH